MPVDTRLTYDDYCLLPSDGKRYEIIEGELYVSPSPGRRHQRIIINLILHLGGFVKNHSLGDAYVAPFDVVFSQHDVVEPDVIYVSNAHLSLITEKNIQGAPDLAVEVLSDSTARLDRTTKLKLYSRFGVQEYWIVDPEGPSVEIYRRMEAGLDLAGTLQNMDSLTSPLFPGFSLPVRSLVE